MFNHPDSPPPRPHGFIEAAARYRLHPLVALTLFVVDHALGALEVSSLGLFAIISAFVGCLLVLPVTFIQRREYGQPWEVAASVGVICGILTAIPTPIGAYLNGIWAITAFVGRKPGPPSGDHTIDAYGEEQ
jgi:hypothetical protein